MWWHVGSEEEIEASQKPIKSLKTTQKIVGEWRLFIWLSIKWIFEKKHRDLKFYGTFSSISWIGRYNVTSRALASLGSSACGLHNRFLTWSNKIVFLPVTSLSEWYFYFWRLCLLNSYSVFPQQKKLARKKMYVRVSLKMDQWSIYGR